MFRNYLNLSLVIKFIKFEDEINELLYMNVKELKFTSYSL